ncbi:hypothetical protein GCM10008025_05860 [Ornithinibacillus halotolerans]|uniref:Uncharacterized protein n=1 Tax=Ornithinibacillus halotolerans TaxID=1274357 RepID=A0A916RS03_9BACI|nr:hypothetical protein GCM10008025_05860 [Ornithinibacillus halotolerans]
MPFLPQDKERFVSDTSHAEKAFFFFKESPYISGASVVIVRNLLPLLKLCHNLMYLYHICTFY